MKDKNAPKEPRFTGEVTEKSHKNMSKIKGKNTKIEFFHGKDWEVLKPRLEKGKNPDYWVKKIERNIQRDMEKDQALQYLGWTVIHFWGKDILRNPDECIHVIEEIIFEQKIDIMRLDEEIDYE